MIKFRLKQRVLLLVLEIIKRQSAVSNDERIWREELVVVKISISM